MNLLDLYENREPYQQAIDKLEQRRIEDLEARMDDCARRGDKEGFQKCKAERDSYHKIKETHDTTEKDSQGHATGFSHEGDWKKIPKNKAGRPVDPRGEVTHLSDRARREAERAAKADVAEGAGEFLYKKLRPSQYGGVDVVGFKEAPRSSVLSGQVLKHFIDSYETEEEALKAHPDAEGYSNNYTDPQVSLSHLPGEDDPVSGGMYPDDIDEQGMSEGVDEAGIGQDLVTPQQRVQQSTPQKQTPIQKVGSTVKHAANWLAGRGGPGKEGPTYEGAELNEQDSPVNTAKFVWAQIAKAVNSNVDVATITWPDGQSQKLTRNQLWHIDQKARTMSRQARNQFALKTFVNVNNLMYYLGTLKAVKPRPQLRPEVDPSQPSLDLPKPTLEDSKKKDSLTTPGNPEAEVAIKLARSRHPTAKSDLEALVQDKIATDKTVKKEIDQVKADNERQEKEIQSLEKETNALSIAASDAGKLKNFDTDADPTTPLPPSAGAFVPTASTPPAATTTIPASPGRYPSPAPDTVRALEPTVTKDKKVKDKETPVTKPPGVQYRQVSQPTRLSNRPTRASLPAPETPDTIPLDFGPGWEEVPSTNNKKSSEDDLDIFNFNDEDATAATTAAIKKASGKTTKKQKTKEPAMAESKMGEIDAARQDLELMNDRQFYTAYGMSKVAFQQKYRSLLKPVEPRYTNENVDADDWDEDEGDFVNDPTVHAQVKKQPLPDSVLRAIERNPSMRADIIAAYKRKQGINEVTDMMTEPLWKDLLGIMLIPATMFGFAAWYKFKDKIKLYRAEDAIRALDRKGIRVDRATFDLVRPMLQKFEQALAAKDAELAQDLADQIQKTVAWGKLKQSSTQANTVTPNKEKDQGMSEGSWGGSGPGGLLTPYAVYTKQNGQVKRIKSTNKIGRPMNTREAEAYVAAMRKRDPARWTHDTVWVAPADIDLGEAANPAQQAAIAIAMKRAGKKPKSVDEGNPNSDPWYVYAKQNPKNFKKFKTYDAAKAYAEKHGLTCASSGHFHDHVSVKGPQGVDEAQTDYFKRRQRERDVDAGRPVKALPKNPQTDYAKKRAKEKRDLEQFGESYTESVKSQGVTDAKLLKAAARIDRLAESFK